MSELGLAGIPISSGQMNAAGSAATVSPQPRLVTAAHEFEAAMMKELMAPLEQGKDILGGNEEESGSNSALGSFAGEALGKAISEHGGFGIAKSIIAQLSHPANRVPLARSNHSGNASVPKPEREQPRNRLSND
jgi:Rod binding domain-containing protein